MMSKRRIRPYSERREGAETLIRNGASASMVRHQFGIPEDKARELATELGIALIEDGRRVSQKRKPIPIGTVFGNLTTVSDADYWTSNGTTHSTVKVQCTCGTVKVISTYSLRVTSKGLNFYCSYDCPDRIWVKGDNHHSFLGHGVPRSPSQYREVCEDFQTGLCAWCGKTLDGVIHVDHSHKRHDDCSGHLSCTSCIRGAVHIRCNQEIKHWDWAATKNLGPIPAEVAVYLSRSLSVTEGFLVSPTSKP